jgi:hypothetical protein
MNDENKYNDNSNKGGKVYHLFSDYHKKEYTDYIFNVVDIGLKTSSGQEPDEKLVKKLHRAAMRKKKLEEIAASIREKEARAEESEASTREKRTSLSILKGNFKATIVSACAAAMSAVAAIFGVFNSNASRTQEVVLTIRDERFLPIDGDRKKQLLTPADPPDFVKLVKEINNLYPELKTSWQKAFDSLQAGKDVIATKNSLIGELKRVYGGIDADFKSEGYPWKTDKTEEKKSTSNLDSLIKLIEVNPVITFTPIKKK